MQTHWCTFLFVPAVGRETGDARNSLKKSLEVRENTNEDSTAIAGTLWNGINDGDFRSGARIERGEAVQSQIG
jgi:hypothetical protein